MKKYILIIFTVLIIMSFAGCNKENNLLLSDDEKIINASAKVNEKKYAEALDIIDDVNTTKADALREYIKVCKARDEYMKVFDVKHIVYNEDDQVYRKMNNFKEKIISFDNNSFVELLISDSFRERCENDLKGIEKAKSVYDLKEGLKSYFEFFIYHNMEVRGEKTVTRYDLINKELRAAIIDEFMFDASMKRFGLSQSGVGEDKFKAFDDEINKLKELTETMKKKEKSMAKELKKQGYSLDDSVYYIQDPKYNLDTSHNLENVVTEEDCENNATVLIRTYETEIVAAFISKYES